LNRHLEEHDDDDTLLLPIELRACFVDLAAAAAAGGFGTFDTGRWNGDG
jgi:hypothetical protein